MVTTCMHTLSTGVELECRTSGEPGQPLLLFLHGFPEGAFIWDGLLEQFGSVTNAVQAFGLFFTNIQ